jgi:flagellar FliL protein
MDMSDETHPTPAAEPEAATASPEASGAPDRPRSNRVALLAVLVVAGVAGVGSGFVVGPKFVSHSARPDPVTTDHEDAESATPGAFFELQNIVVNPAGSDGMRFLMVSVAVEVPAQALAERLREHQVRVRDVVVSVLERQTLESLTQPGARDRVKVDLADAIAPFVEGKRPTVYLPQFVIQ